MPIISTNALTLADWAKRMDDQQKTAYIVELLSQENGIMRDCLWVEGNLPTGHKTTVRTGIPQGTWRLLYQGLPPVKSTTAQVTDVCGNLEALNQIDKDLADLNSNTASFRLSETNGTMMGLGQQMATTMFYGNVTVNPERFTGITPRYSAITGAASGANIIDAGGTGSTNTSIWFITWGEQTVHGIFPKGKKTGLIHSDMGEDWAFDASNNRYRAYLDHFKWEAGLTVRDWRYCVRIANIDVNQLISGAAPNLMNLLIRALHRIPTIMGGNVQQSDAPTIAGSMGKTVIYCNRTITTYFDIQNQARPNALFSMKEYDGMPILTFRNIPIRVCDALLNTESRVI
jgi:hypothetical protein